MKWGIMFTIVHTVIKLSVLVIVRSVEARVERFSALKPKCTNVVWGTDATAPTHIRTSSYAIVLVGGRKK